MVLLECESHYAILIGNAVVYWNSFKVFSMYMMCCGCNDLSYCHYAVNKVFLIFKKMQHIYVLLLLLSVSIGCFSLCLALAMLWLTIGRHFQISYLNIHTNKIKQKNFSFGFTDTNLRRKKIWSRNSSQESHIFLIVLEQVSEMIISKALSWT